MFMLDHVGQQANPYLEPRQPAFRPSLVGAVKLVTPPTDLLVPLDEMKNYLKVTLDADNTLIENMIRDKTELFQEMIPGQPQFLTATYDVPVAGWWWDKPLSLPRPPLQSVTSISYYDPFGNLAVLDTSLYLVRTALKMPGQVERAPYTVFPAHQADRAYPITIRFVAGYGAVTDVPRRAKGAITSLVYDQYFMRGATSAAFKAATSIPFSVQEAADSLAAGGYA